MSLPGYVSSGVAESVSPLDVDQHPVSPAYESLFPDQVVPLDTRLSWKNRFLGDESFNAEEALPATSPVIDQSSIHSRDAVAVDGKPSNGFDTTGIVKQVRLSEGKVKIQHGPIDRLGMPAMTMMFRVEQPGLLTGLDKGTEVAFNVDNTSAGFSITQLQNSREVFDTTGIVKQLKSAEGKVKIEHGPIERLGMPAMTMLFRVEDTGQLAGLDKGSKVAFNVDNTNAGFSITKIERVDEVLAEKFDASGVVKSIRASQGKIKIEHGPIDRLGMPGMTMLFKIKNADDLKRLEPDMRVDFNVINGSAGFEITDIKPVQAMMAGTDSSMSREVLCYAIGPFKKRADALMVMEKYRAQGAISMISSRVEPEYVGDMVYIPDLGTRDDALSIASKLKARGMTDTRLLNEPGKRNALSLGVFGLKENAEQVRSTAESMDIAVMSEARYRQQSFYWLHNQQRDQTPVLELLSSDDVDAGIRQVSSNCKAGEDK